MDNEKISAVYIIINTATGDGYVGSSRNVEHRWAAHREPSTWKRHPNSSLYKDMQKYGLDKFRFQILAPVMPEHLKQVEQEFIEMLNPTYNDRRSKGWDVERHKETHRKAKEKYEHSEKGKESNRKRCKKYSSRLCLYNGETLTLAALAMRFQRTGIGHPNVEAKKYLIRP